MERRPSMHGKARPDSAERAREKDRAERNPGANSRQPSGTTRVPVASGGAYGASTGQPIMPDANVPRVNGRGQRLSESSSSLPHNAKKGK